jgi:hypothetical protein
VQSFVTPRRVCCPDVERTSGLGADDPFHDATKTLLAPLSTSPSGVPDSLPHGLDCSAREADAHADDEFEGVVNRRVTSVLYLLKH